MSDSPSLLYARHEGGLLSRALGTAVHTLLEELARLRVKLDWEAARSGLQQFEARVAAEARAVGVDQPQAARIAARALEIALDSSRDAIGSWLLSPHSGAASEAEWAGVIDGGLRTVRVDRAFKAGSTPGSESGSGQEDCWWVIDYKTAHTDHLDPETDLAALRLVFAPQVEAYAEILRNLDSGDEPDCRIRAGLFYPRMLWLDWWEV
jgi:hypothetical protein